MVIALYTVCAPGFYGFSRSYKSFDKYYPTALFVSTISLLYPLLCRGHLLWHFRKWYFFTDKLSLLAQFSILLPCVTILFLRYIENRRNRAKVLIYLAFVAIFVLMELLLWMSDEIVYAFGWNFGWSVFIDFCLFAMAWIHSRNTRVALVVAVFVIILLMFWFRIPLTG